MLIKNVRVTCSRCGAMLSNEVAQQKGIKDVCPICNDQYAGHRGYKLKKIYNDFENIPHKFGLKVDAVYVDNNNIGNPRLVIRFPDHYFNDYKGLVLPDGFEIKRTRGDGRPPCPIEMIYTFDVDDITMVDDMPDEYALEKVLSSLAEWIRNFKR